MRKLQFKLVAILVLLVITVMTIIGVYLINRVGTYYEDQFYTEIGDVFSADVRDLLTQYAEETNGAQTIIDYINNAHAAPLGLHSSRTFFLLDGYSGAVLGGSAATADTPEKTRNVIAALAGEVGMESAAGEEYFDFAFPIQAGTSRYILYIRDDRVQVEEMQQMLLSAVLQALLIGLVISLLLSVMLSKTISGPIERLTRSAQLVAAGDFTSKPPAASNDEIGILTRTFNDMSQALEDTLGDVANERDKLSAVFQHMTDGILAMDFDGHILQYNEAARVLLQLPENGVTDEAVRLQFEALRFDPNAPQETAEEKKERYYAVGGRTLQFFRTPFGREEMTGGIVIVVYDVTERERLNRSRRAFLADVSHELRSPLTSIRGYTETLIDDPEMDAETRQQFLQVVMKEADRMTRLVKDLQIISRLEDGKIDWAITQVDPAELLQNVVTAHTLDASRHGQILTLTVQAPLPAVAADQDRLSQVFANIITNAIKYTPEGGRIEVEAEAAAGGIAVSIRDDGIGIPADDLPHIFERFYRVDKARSRDSGGSGLGLAIAKEFIMHLQGTIGIESKNGKGTAVTIWLPAAEGGAV